MKQPDTAALRERLANYTPGRGVETGYAGA